MTLDVNIGAGHTGDGAPERDAAVPGQAPGQHRDQRSEPPVLRSQSPETANIQAPPQPGNQEVENMLNRAVEQIGESERHYESALDQLDTRLDQLSSEARSVQDGQTNPALQQVEREASNLSQQVRRNDPKLQTQNDRGEMDEMSRRIDALATNPNTNPGPPGGDVFGTPSGVSAGPVLDEAQLDDRFKAVTSELGQSLNSYAPAQHIEAAADEAQNLTQNLATATDPGQLNAIIERLRGLEGYLSRAEEQHSRIGAIESHLINLIESVSASGAQMEGIARQSAREAAELVKSQGPSNAAERLDAIVAELAALNARALQMDERTVGTLETMNGTLTSLVNKISPPGPANAAPARPEWNPDTGPSEHQGTEDRAGVQSSGDSEPHPTGHHANISAPIPEYQPAPQTREPRSDSIAAILDRTRRETSAEATGQHQSSADFIASARRAAEAASRAPSAMDQLSDAPQSTQPGLTNAPQSDAAQAKSSRPVLVIVAVSLLILSAALFYNRLKALNDAPPMQGPSQLQPGEMSPATRAPARNETEGTAEPPALQPSRDGAPAPYLPGDTSSQTPAPTLQNGAQAAKSREGSPAGPPSWPPHLISNTLPVAKFQIVEPTVSLGGSGTQAQIATVPAMIGIAKPTPVSMPPATIGSDALRTAAANGDPRAQFEIAARFAKGDDGARNFAAAALWYHRAAAQGFAPAQYRLAALYERGHGMKRDIGRARVWYLRAAEAGNIKAMHNLAVLHTKGLKDGADYTTAALWFAKAADHGLPDSQFNLGILYENGLGLRKDLKQAYKWFTLAAKAGDGEAEKRAKHTAFQLPPQDKTGIEQAVGQWQAQASDVSANKVAPPQAGWRRAAAARGPQVADPLVSRAQALLNRLGYDAGLPDGLMGPKTSEAIDAFQESLGLDRTGRVTPNLITRLELRTG